jgi:hypothetical protein
MEYRVCFNVAVGERLQVRERPHRACYRITVIGQGASAKWCLVKKGICVCGGPGLRMVSTIFRFPSFGLPCCVCARVRLCAQRGVLLHIAESETGQQKKTVGGGVALCLFCIGFQCNFVRASWPPPLYFSLPRFLSTLHLCNPSPHSPRSRQPDTTADIHDGVCSEHGRVICASNSPNRVDPHRAISVSRLHVLAA